MAADEIVDDRRAAAIGHARQLDAQRLLEPRSREMRNGAVARHAEGGLVRCEQRLHQLFQRRGCVGAPRKRLVLELNYSFAEALAHERKPVAFRRDVLGQPLEFRGGFESGCPPAFYRQCFLNYFIGGRDQQIALAAGQRWV